MRNIVVDSGVFIALFDKSDRHHAQAKQFIRDVQGHLHTCTVASVDSDFTVYRDYVRQHFTNVLWGK